MSEKAVVINVVTEMVEAVNQGEFDRALSAFAGNASVVEDIAPFHWHGPSAASDWLQAMGANAAKLNISAILMKVGLAERVELEGDHAYVVIPGSLRMTVMDSEHRSDGLLTVTLCREDARWLIGTLTWSGPRPTVTE